MARFSGQLHCRHPSHSGRTKQRVFRCYILGLRPFRAGSEGNVIFGQPENSRNLAWLPESMDRSMASKNDATL